MIPFLTEEYGNPHSRTHLYGWEAEEAVEVARGQVGSSCCRWRNVQSENREGWQGWLEQKDGSRGCAGSCQRGA